MPTPLKLEALGQIARTVKDITESQRWYQGVLGLPHLYTYGKLAFFDVGGVRLMLSQVDTPPAAESILYLQVTDIQAAYQAMKDNQVEFLNGPHLVHRHPDGTEEWLAFFKDPEGRPLALMSQVKLKG